MNDDQRVTGRVCGCGQNMSLVHETFLCGVCDRWEGMNYGGRRGPDWIEPEMRGDSNAGPS